MDPQEENGAHIFVLEIDGFASKVVQAINFVFYYDVSIPELHSIYSTAAAFSLVGNIAFSTISGELIASPAEPLDKELSGEPTPCSLEYLTSSSKSR